MVQISFLGIVVAVLVMLVKDLNGRVGVYVSLAGGVCLLLVSLPFIEDIYNMVQSLSAKSGMSSAMLLSLIKIAGMAIVTEFTASFCVDAGETSLGDKVNFVGKLAILTSCVPVITTIFDIAESLAK